MDLDQVVATFQQQRRQRVLAAFFASQHRELEPTKEPDPAAAPTQAETVAAAQQPADAQQPAPAEQPQG